MGKGRLVSFIPLPESESWCFDYDHVCASLLQLGRLNQPKGLKAAYHRSLGIAERIAPNLKPLEQVRFRIPAATSSRYTSRFPSAALTKRTASS